MNHITIALLAATVLNLALTGYALYQVDTYNERIAALNQVVGIHDQAILGVICVAQIPGIIDLAQCAPNQ
jgi:hypothetical protein